MLAHCQIDAFARKMETSIVSVREPVAETGKKGKKKGAASGPARGQVVVLADTVLFPEGGGQPNDRGTIGGRRVMDVQRGDGGVIEHTLEAGQEPLAADGTVEVEKTFV